MKTLLFVLALLITTQSFAACVPKRDAEGKILRSRAVIAKFQRTTVCPATGKTGRCPGYVVDHKIPLCACGRDAQSNLQYQTVAAGKIKDQQERIKQLQQWLDERSRY